MYLLGNFKYDIDNIIKYSKEDENSYNWYHPKGESVSNLLEIDNKTLYYGGFKFCQTGLIRKVLEATGMDDFYGFSTATKVKASLGKDENVSEAKRDFTNSYVSVIGIMVHLASNTRPDISFDFHECNGFTHNTKESNEIYVKMIFRYLQGTKDKCLIFNTSKKLVVDYYYDADFAGTWGHGNPQDFFLLGIGLYL